MNLAQTLGLTLGSQNVILVGKPEVTNLLDSDEKPYYVAKLKSPITVRCSIDTEILPFETDEVYIRESALTGDGWAFVDEKKPEEGFYMPNWTVDFSKGQQIAIYQETSIKKWTRTNRGNQRSEQRERINEAIKKRMEKK